MTRRRDRLRIGAALLAAAGAISFAACSDDLAGDDALSAFHVTGPAGAGDGCDGEADGTCALPSGEGCACADCQALALCVPGQCVDDGACTLHDACTCGDCWTDDAFCHDPSRANCTDDGACDGFLEGCLCADCAADAACAGFEPPSPPEAAYCQAPSDAPSKGACVAIGPNVACNPVTNEGCDGAAGAACDLGGDGFECFPDRNERALCEACGGTKGFCEGTMGCHDGRCARYCCDAADCGSGGACDVEAVGFAGAPIGFCVERTGSGDD
jgi:hypothetical protein